MVRSSNSSPSAAQRTSKRLNPKRKLASQEALEILELFQKKTSTALMFQNWNIENFYALGVVVPKDKPETSEGSSEKLTLYKLICKKGTSSMHYSKPHILQRQAEEQSFAVQPEADYVQDHMSNDEEIDNLIGFLQHAKQSKKDKAALERIKELEIWYEKNSVIEKINTRLKRLEKIQEEIDDLKEDKEDIQAGMKRAKTPEKKNKRKKRLRRKHEEIEKAEEKLEAATKKVEQEFNKTVDELRQKITDYNNQSPSRLPNRTLVRSPPSSGKQIEFGEEEDGEEEDGEEENSEEENSDEENSDEEEDEAITPTRKNKRAARNSSERRKKRQKTTPKRQASQ